MDHIEMTSSDSKGKFDDVKHSISTFNGVNPWETQIVDEELILSENQLSEIICKRSWSPISFRYVTNYKTKKGKLVTGKYRSKETSNQTSLVVADVDEGLSLVEAKAICEKYGHKYIIGITKSHQKEKNGKPPCDRFRVILILDRAVDTGSEYELVWNHIKFLFNEKIDNQCKDSARYYAPCIAIYAEDLRGSPVEVDLIPPHQRIDRFSDLQNPKFTNKGNLKASTIDFLLYGRGASEEKEWHLPFIRAASDLRDQGYSIDEATRLLKVSSENEKGDLDATDIDQIKDIYSRPQFSALRTEETIFPKTFESEPILGEEAYFGKIGELVKKIQPHTESDTVGILIQFLTMLGVIAGRSIYYLVEETKHFLNIFTVLVGDTAGGRKGTGYGRAISLFQEIDSGWVKNNVMPGGLASGEGFIHMVRDPQKKNGTTRKQDDPGILDKRMLIHEAEFASVLKVASKDGNTLSPQIRNAYDSGNLRNLSKMNSEKATGAHIGIIGHITAAELNRYLTSTEANNGFSNRIIWISVKRKNVLPFGGDFRITSSPDLISYFRKVLEFAQIERQLFFDSEAAELWESMYRKIAGTKKVGLYGAITARAEANTLRLAMIYAVSDLSEKIRIEHLKAAIALWKYSEESCFKLFGKRSGDFNADKILAFISRPPFKVSRSNITHKIFSKNKSTEEVEQVIRYLEDLGFIHRSYESENGNTTEYIVSNLTAMDREVPTGDENEVH